VAEFAHPTTVENAIAGAKTALTMLGTYSYSTYDKNVAEAAQYLTPAYAAHFKATAMAQKPVAVKLHNVSRVSAVTVGISSLAENLESATVVAGFTLTVTGESTPHRQVSKIAATATLIELNQKWQLGSLTIPPIGPAAGPTYALASSDLADAMTAATNVAVVVGTLRRTHIATDYAAWLADTTGGLHAKLAKARKRTEAAFTHSKADLRTVCKAIGIVTIGSHSVEFLVYVSSSGSLTANTLSELTVDNVGGRWLGESINTV
jgi:hypothetical protein